MYFYFVMINNVFHRMLSMLYFFLIYSILYIFIKRLLIARVALPWAMGAVGRRGRFSWKGGAPATGIESVAGVSLPSRVGGTEERGRSADRAEDSLLRFSMLRLVARPFGLALVASVWPTGGIRGRERRQRTTRWRPSSFFFNKIKFYKE